MGKGEKSLRYRAGNTEIDYVKALGADEIVVLNRIQFAARGKLCRNAGLVIGRQNGLLLMAATAQSAGHLTELHQANAVMVNGESGLAFSKRN